MSENNWTTYILECADGTLYCGATNSLEKRYLAHNSGKGAKYTRARLPLKFVANRDNLTKSQALKLEYKVKHTPRNRKIEVLKNSEVN